jgi:WD40 repeat protein
MRSARLLQDLKHHTKRVHSLAFHPEEQLLVSSSADRTVSFWDLCTQEQCDKAGPLAKEVRGLLVARSLRYICILGQLQLPLWSWYLY